MRTFFKLFAFLAILLFFAMLGGGFAIWHGINELPGLSVNINGEDLALHGMDLGDLIGAVIGLGVAGVVLLIVVPLVLLFSVGLPLLIMGAVIAAVVLAVCGVGAVLGSPLILLALILWLVFRPRRRRVAKLVEPSV
ncbi:MAG TPA: hypothetical protein VGE47_03165 [Burkholderiaceae bacterium]